MIKFRKHFCLSFFVLAGMTALPVMQSLVLHHVYRLTCRQLLMDIQEAFSQAYQKEQTYRIPVVDIINPGPVTIESCGTEEVQIIRKCPEPDTIVYNNPSGYSIETFITRVFVDLREHIEPMNIHCLADLFAGMLHDRNIPVNFVIEKFDMSSGKVLDSSLLPDKKQPEMNPATTIIMDISEHEALRAILQITPGVVLGNMTEVLICSVFLIIIEMIFLCFILYCKNPKTRAIDEGNETAQSEPVNGGNMDRMSQTFAVGQYLFIPAKNELQGFGKSILLNKKENAILYSLCTQCGNVVARSALLEENWGDSGFIYTRSLDTYITTLRKYFKKDAAVQIVTIKGVGYRLVCQKTGTK
jgi:DNA-binding winged helix-turn-helix (wHTH) protein